MPPRYAPIVGPTVVDHRTTDDDNNNNNNNGNLETNNASEYDYLDSFVVQLHKLLDMTGKLMNTVSRSRRDREHALFDLTKQRHFSHRVTASSTRNVPSLSLSSSSSSSYDEQDRRPGRAVDVPPSTTLTSRDNDRLSSSCGLLTQSYVYAIFTLIKFTPQLTYTTGNHHPICGHLKSDVHVVEKAWYYMRRLRANFVTSLRQKMRRNRNEFRFIGCCESPDKNIAVLSGLSKQLRRDYPAHCFNVQGHVISMSLLLHSSVELANDRENAKNNDVQHASTTSPPSPPSDAYIFNNMLLVVRQRNTDDVPSTILMREFQSAGDFVDSALAPSMVNSFLFAV